MVRAPCYQDGGPSALRPSLTACGEDLLCLVMVRRIALFSASILHGSGQLLSHHGKGLLAHFFGHNLNRLSLAIHDHAHQHSSTHVLGDGRPFLCGALLNEVTFLLRNLELERFGFGVV